MMLGYDDIISSLGKDISVYPFHERYIKGDALNLSASEFAWSLSEGEFWIDEDGVPFINQSKSISNANHYFIKEKADAVVEYNGKKYIVVLPQGTTLIETNEIIAVSNKIGGCYHSKVSIVSKGLCHIGTYLEPNYCGHSLVSIQNSGKNVILLLVGEVFTAITFFELNTAVPKSLKGANGSRFEILVQCGIHVSEEAKVYLSEQWKNNPDEISRKMQESSEYRQLMKNVKRRKIHSLLEYLNFRNIMILLLVIVIIVGGYGGAYLMDSHTGTRIWRDRFWNVGFSGIICSVIFFVLGLIQKK